MVVAYRSAINGEGRHTQVLTIGPNGMGSTDMVHAWELNACPVTTNSMARDGKGDNWLVFATRGQLFQIGLADQANPTLVQQRSQSAQSTNQKHPSMAFNARGEKLIVWTDGPGFFGGGVLRWQQFDAAGEPARSSDDSQTLPVLDNSVAAVTALPDDSFFVVY